jgi:hypothetical protein
LDPAQLLSNATSARPLFIIGYQRSGTTFLREVLVKQFSVVIPPECSYISWLEPSFGNWKWPARVNEIDCFAEELANTRKFENWLIERRQVVDWIKAAEPSSYAQLCATVHYLWGASHGVAGKRWGDKNNVHGLEISRLLRIFPNAEFLWISRDPRDVWASERNLATTTHSQFDEMRPKIRSSVHQFIEDWVEHEERVAEAFAGKKVKMLRVGFESLVMNFSSTLGRLQDFFNLEPRKQILSAAELENVRKLELAYPWKDGVLSEPELSKIGAFSRTLNPREVRLISVAWEQHLGKLAKKYSGKQDK